MGHGAAMQARFSPYDYNGGTTLAVAGKDFCIVAGDTRMSTGFSIKSRNVSKIYKLAGNVVLGTAGFRGDITTLQKLLRAKLTSYEHQHGVTMKAHAVGQMLGNTLYGRRFFPYYSAGERDIRTGDCVEICIITKDGIKIESYPLN